jgi:flagellar protein FliS
MSYGYGTKTTAYLEADILSRPKEWLIPLLYEHLLSSLRRAAVQIEANDHEGRAQSLEKASAIVLELSSSLNHELGSEVARQMSSLYAFFVTEILQIGLTRDLNRLRGLVEIVAELTVAWTEAAEQVAPRGGAGRPVAASAA